MKMCIAKIMLLLHSIGRTTYSLAYMTIIISKRDLWSCLFCGSVDCWTWNTRSVITAVIIINYPHILGQGRQRGARSGQQHMSTKIFFLDQTKKSIMQKLGHLDIHRRSVCGGLLFYCPEKISVMMAKSIVVAYKNG